MRSSSLIGLKCPYCDEEFSTHKQLRVHIGSEHKEKTHKFMEEYLGGRLIEVDFLTLMLQRATQDLTPEFCQECGACAEVCPSAHIYDDFNPLEIISQVRMGNVRDILKLDVLWSCVSCLSCVEACPKPTSPHEVIDFLRNLSARIGYHLPRTYKDLEKAVYRTGIIQDLGRVTTRSGVEFGRSDLGLPPINKPSDLEKFKLALDELAGRRVIF